jgi:hypothetical protein
MVIILIFAVFPIYWASLWKTPDGKLDGWVIVGSFIFFVPYDVFIMGDRTLTGAL